MYRLLMALNIAAMRYSYRQFFIAWVLTGITVYTSTWIGSVVVAAIVHLAVTVTIFIKIRIDKMTGGR